MRIWTSLTPSISTGFPGISFARRISMVDPFMFGLSILMIYDMIECTAGILFSAGISGDEISTTTGFYDGIL